MWRVMFPLFGSVVFWARAAGRWLRFRCPARGRSFDLLRGLMPRSIARFFASSIILRLYASPSAQSRTGPERDGSRLPVGRDRSLPSARPPAPLGIAPGEARSPDHRDRSPPRAQPPGSHARRLEPRPAGRLIPYLTRITQGARSSGPYGRGDRLVMREPL